MSRPFVSVVIPTFNRPDATLQAVASARAQTFADIEILVIDDASDAPFVLRGEAVADERVRIVRLTTNAGPAGARNSGVAAAQAPWIAFLDSDDLWRPDKLDRQLELLRELDPSISAVSCGFRKLDAGDGVDVSQIPIESDEPAFFASGCWFCPGTTAVVGKAAFDRVGGFDERLRRLEDLDWYLRFALAGGSLRVAPVVMCDVRIGGRPRLSTVDAAARLILDKFNEGDLPSGIDPSLRNRLAAYLDLERAAAAWTEGPRSIGRATLTAAYLARSFLRRPRGRLHLEAFWMDPQIESE